MSISAQLAQGSTLHIEGSAATPATLTAVVAGYPTILAMTGHSGVANGDFITFSSGFTGTDAAYLNGKTAVVTKVATGATNDTFAVDINTAGKTITIGTATATPTAWIAIGELKGIKPSGASSSKIDVTDLNSVAKEYRTGLVDHGTFSAEINILESDSGQAACLTAFTASTVKNFKYTTPGKTRTFSGTILKFPTAPDATVDGVQVGSMEVQINGLITVA